MLRGQRGGMAGQWSRCHSGLTSLEGMLRGPIEGMA